AVRVRSFRPRACFLRSQRDCGACADNCQYALPHGLRTIWKFHPAPKREYCRSIRRRLVRRTCRPFPTGGKTMPPINYVAVLVAAVAGWLVGAVWYGVLGKQWMAALGWTEADITGPDGKRRMPMGPMIVAFIAQLVMAL